MRNINPHIKRAMADNLTMPGDIKCKLVRRLRSGPCNTIFSALWTMSNIWTEVGQNTRDEK